MCLAGNYSEWLDHLSSVGLCMNTLQPQVKKQQPINAPAHRSHAHSHTHSTTFCTYTFIYSNTHTLVCTQQQRALLAFSKTSPWTEASASAAINHSEAGAEGMAHLVHVAPTPGLNKP